MSPQARAPASISQGLSGALLAGEYQRRKVSKNRHEEGIWEQARGRTSGMARSGEHRAVQLPGAYTIASVKIYPRAILITPGTSGYYISYNRVLRAVLQKPIRWGMF